MSPPTVTVAIPVLNGERYLPDLLGTIQAQRIDASVEIIVADSDSTDDSAAIARAHGAEVIRVPRGTYSHGGTRNMMVERASGELVALLTQDALPASEHWLAELTGAFALEPGVGLAFGPGIPRPDSSLSVRQEMTSYFRSLSPTGETMLVRLGEGEQAVTNESTYYHSVNGCVARAAWSEVPFRTIAYAEDRMLAIDMLRAGWAKAFVPAAGVIHSHDFSPIDVLRRSFDDFRGLREVGGYYHPKGLREGGRWMLEQIRGDVRFATDEGAGCRAILGALPASVLNALLWHVGGVLGTRADTLPRWARARLSRERRDSFVAQPPR
jgi:rhamnosyltransferase